MKKAISLLLVYSILMSYSVVFASTGNPDVENGTIIKTQIFNDLKTKSNTLIIGPMSEEYPDGTIKIDDIIGSYEYGPTSYNSEDFSNLSTFQNAIITLATNIPQIGDWIQSGLTVYGWAKDIFSDLDTVIDKYSPTTFDKVYSYRYFYHELYAWNGNSSYWQNVGESTSRYYYEKGTFWYHKNEPDKPLARVIMDHTISDGPDKVIAASHYMNYPYLTDQASYAYHYSTFFYEGY